MKLIFDRELLIILVIIQIFNGLGIMQLRKTRFIWQEVDEWNKCSTTCGEGIQEKRIICIVKLDYSEAIVEDEKCSDLPSLSPSTRDCNMGDCEGNYMWRPGKWSDCSQTCGIGGRKTRDVECVYDEGSGNLVTSDFKYCTQNLRPESSASCNVLDCPFIIVPGEWGKCVQKRHKCLPGIQRRTITCVSILKNGETKSLDRFACNTNGKPPVTWRKCDDHLNDKECLKNNQNFPIILKSKNNTLYQMRKTKLLNIVVGQIAYVLLYTKITINCPVTYFVPREVEWNHGSINYKYQGKSKDRIRVDKNGRIRIRKLEAKDSGIWTCFAGLANATATIKVRNPSVGFQDWILRSALWNKEMMNEDPNSGLRRHDVVQWIKKSWSSCSVTCGGKGFQSREVHCEKLDTRFYNIIDDKSCMERSQEKPLSKRSCQMASNCPQWSLLNADRSKCTNKCSRIGYGKIQGQLYCVHQKKEMDFSACNKTEMPDIECPNEKCQVSWKKSHWSKCSKSCGGLGIMARYLICIWSDTEDPAGSLCYTQNLKLPTVIKSCNAPKCNLKCVDLSANCKNRRKFCKLTIYRYTCCKTCSISDVQSQMQSDEYVYDKNKLNKAISDSKIKKNKNSLKKKSRKQKQKTSKNSNYEKYKNLEKLFKINNNIDQSKKSKE